MRFCGLGEGDCLWGTFRGSPAGPHLRPFSVPFGNLKRFFRIVFVLLCPVLSFGTRQSEWNMERFHAVRGAGGGVSAA